MSRLPEKAKQNCPGKKSMSKWLSHQKNLCLLKREGWSEMGAGGVQFGVVGDSALRTSVLIPGALAAAHPWFLLFGLPAGWEGFGSPLACAKQPGQPRCQPQENQSCFRS